MTRVKLKRNRSKREAKEWAMKNLDPDVFELRVGIAIEFMY
jgi:hypothetical protein